MDHVEKALDLDLVLDKPFKSYVFIFFLHQ